MEVLILTHNLVHYIEKEIIQSCE